MTATFFCTHEGCGRTFKAQQGLAAHARSHRDPVITSMPHTCPECERTFPRSQALGLHRRRAHGVLGTTRKSKKDKARVACEHCSKTYADPSGLSKHKRTAHAGGFGTKRRAKAEPKPELGLQDPALDVILEHLLPNGVPARKVPALLRWLDATRELMN